MHRLADPIHIHNLTFLTSKVWSVWNRLGEKWMPQVGIRQAWVSCWLWRVHHQGVNLMLKTYPRCMSLSSCSNFRFFMPAEWCFSDCSHGVRLSGPVKVKEEAAESGYLLSNLLPLGSLRFHTKNCLERWCRLLALPGVRLDVICANHHSSPCLQS